MPIKKDNEAVVMFLNSILEKADEYSRHVDNQINILVGLCTAIFVFCAAQIQTFGFANSAYWTVLGLFSVTAAIVGLFGLHPPRFISKHGQKESYMYSKNIANADSAKEYAEKLAEIVKSEDKITEQYSIEIYNVYKYYYRPKRSFFKASRSVLITGLLTTSLLFIISYI